MELHFYAPWITGLNLSNLLHKTRRAVVSGGLRGHTESFPIILRRQRFAVSATLCRTEHLGDSLAYL